MRRNKAETKTDADFADDLSLLKNTPAPAEYILYRLLQAAGGIFFFVDANKTEFLYFWPLKL